ncbi:hypothetical protein IMZ48_48690 [Candidatus Bathyarchaeota archaeon]|nr:hypothetical protein [Candidatus Bathyarchaeota archaeon]
MPSTQFRSTSINVLVFIRKDDCEMGKCMGLTVLSGLLETSKKVVLNIRVVRVFGKTDLVPRLRCRPSTGLTMAQDLLVDVEDLHLRGKTLQSVRLVDMCVYVLQPLHGLGLLFNS